MRSLFSAALAAFLVGALAPALAQDKIAKKDLQTLSKLAEGDMAEVATGKLAQNKASSDAVKKFGARMAEDHGKMLEEKKQMAQAKGVKLPDGPNKKHQAEMKKLEGLSGAGFDREYMSNMVKDHQEDLKEVRKTAKSAKDPELKAGAQKAEPIISEHLKMAKEIQASLGGATSTKGGSARESKKQ
jgi:putative membrane protein